MLGGGSPRSVLQLCRTLAAMAGKTCNGSVVCTSTSRSKWCRIACIHWNFTHGLCVVQFSKSLHVLQTIEYMTWKMPTHIYEACNQHNSSCCKMEPPWQLRLDLAMAGKQVPMGNNGPKFLINGYFVTDRTLHTSSVNLTANNRQKNESRILRTVVRQIADRILADEYHTKFYRPDLTDRTAPECGHL